MNKELTFAMVREVFEGQGESVMRIAFSAQNIVDDPELAEAAKAAIDAEDGFDQLLRDRDFER